jgi:transcriptional regulator with XRE-family HTH domain
MNLNSKPGLIARLRRGKEARRQFTASHVDKTIAHQLRATRDALGWSQERLAEEVGMTQNAISRLESVGYGKPTITTLKRLAAALDVSLIVRFAPFSELVDWVSGTPSINEGLTSEALAVATFVRQEEQGVFSSRVSQVPIGFEAMISGHSVQTAGGLTAQSPQRETTRPPLNGNGGILTSADSIVSAGSIPGGLLGRPMRQPGLRWNQ